MDTMTTAATKTTFRPIARITEVDRTLYRWSCEQCSRGDECQSLPLAADYAQWHAVTSGHAVNILAEVK